MTCNRFVIGTFSCLISVSSSLISSKIPCILASFLTGWSDAGIIADPASGLDSSQNSVDNRN